VEVGYAIYAPHRRQGYAHEALVALIRWAHVEAGRAALRCVGQSGQSGVLRAAGPVSVSAASPLSPTMSTVCNT
jgi:hypothetical protein